MTETLLPARRGAQGSSRRVVRGHGVRLLASGTRKRSIRGRGRSPRRRRRSAPASRTSRLATSKAAGVWRRKRCSTRSDAEADDALVGPGHADVGQEGGAAAAGRARRRSARGCACRRPPTPGRRGRRRAPASRSSPRRGSRRTTTLTFSSSSASRRSATRNGRVEVLHEDLALEVDRRHPDSRRGLADVEPAPGIALRVVRRPQQPRLVHRAVSRTSFLSQTWLPVVKAVDRQLVELGEDLRRDAEAARRVLDVDDDVVDPVLVDQPRQQALQRLAARLADHVADEEQLHSRDTRRRASRG